MRTKIEKFSNRLIEKNPSLKFTLPLVVVLFFTWITINNIQEKIEKDTQELFRLSSNVITEYEIYETERDKRFAQILKNIIYEDKDVLEIIKTKKINAEIIDSRLEYLDSKILPFKEKFEHYNSGYKLLKKDFEKLNRLKNYYDRTYRMYRKKGISKKWIYEEFYKKADNDFERKFVKLYKTALSYYEVNELTQFNFNDTKYGKFNTEGFMDRIISKRDWYYSQMLTYKANMKQFSKAIRHYETLKREFFSPQGD